MDSVNKLTVKCQTGYGLKYAYQKIPLIIKTLVKLVGINAFDPKTMRIRDSSGNWMSNTNILDLLSHAMSKGKNTVGASEFIKRLVEADVDKDEEIIKTAQELLKQAFPQEAAQGKYNIKAEQIKGIVGDISGGNVNQTIS